MRINIKNSVLVFLISVFLIPIQSSFASDSFSLQTVIPRNTVEKNSSAKKFIKNLKKIVKKKDLNALMPYISPSIHLSFGGHSGTVDFLKFWNLLEHPKKSTLWKELDKMLKVRGVMDGSKSITYPYLFDDWPDNFDVFEYKAVIGSKVNFRKAPSATAKVIRQISYEVVRSVNEESPTWERVQTHDNKIGYIHSDYVRSAIDYRMFFEKNCDGWKMTTLIAGD